MWRYRVAVRECNVVLTIKITIKGGVFRRFHLCLDAYDRRFLAGYQKVIRVYGCHLKGMFKGQMICIVGNDGNENLFPRAFFVVDIENKETRRIFLTLLYDDIGIIAKMGWIFFL